MKRLFLFLIQILKISFDTRFGIKLFEMCYYLLLSFKLFNLFYKLTEDVQHYSKVKQETESNALCVLLCHGDMKKEKIKNKNF